MNINLINAIEKAVQECQEIVHFCGGVYLYFEQHTVTLTYPTTEVISSLAEHIKNNANHGVTISKNEYKEQ